MNVYEKLMNVQRELKTPKDLYNSFGKYSYRSAESILEAVKPLLSENKAVLNLSDEVSQIGERFYIKATATFTDIEKGENIKVSALAREEALMQCAKRGWETQKCWSEKVKERV